MCCLWPNLRNQPGFQRLPGVLSRACESPPLTASQKNNQGPPGPSQYRVDRPGGWGGVTTRPPPPRRVDKSGWNVPVCQRSPAPPNTRIAAEGQSRRLMGPQDFISAGLAPPDYWRWCAAATGSGTPPRVRIGETCPSEHVAPLEHWNQRAWITAQLDCSSSADHSRRGSIFIPP